MRGLCVILASGLTLLAGAGSAAEPDPTGSAAGQVSAAPPAAPGRVLSVDWTCPVGEIIDSSPAVDKNGGVYFGTFDGQLWCLTPRGSKKWAFRAGREIKASPAIGEDGTVYFGSRDHKFYALRPDGRQRWAFATGAWVDSSAALSGEGTILFGSWDGALYCLDASGRQQWKFETGGPVVSSPAIGRDGITYFGSHDGKFYAVNESGVKKWEYDAGAPIISSPALNNSECVYFTSVNGFCHAVNLDGSRRWRLFTGGITEASPVLAQNGSIYLGVNRAMWTINPAGEQIENYATHEDVVNAATALTDGSYFFVSRRGLVLCLTPQRALVWSFNAQAQGYASPGVGPKGAIYLPTYLSQRDFSALKGGQVLAQSPWPKFRGNSRNTGNAMDN